MCSLRDTNRRPGKTIKGIHFKNLQDNLSATLSGLALTQQSNFDGWTADTDNPGFLVKQSGPAFFRVPAQLIPLFPTGNAIDRIWELGNKVKTSSNSILHIGGSNAMREIFSTINDVDFCEYNTDEASSTIGSLFRLPNQYRDEAPKRACR